MNALFEQYRVALLWVAAVVLLAMGALAGAGLAGLLVALHRRRRPGKGRVPAAAMAPAPPVKAAA